MTDLAPAGHYVADPNHSSVLFRIKHLALAWYTGRFTRLSAALDFDPENPTVMALTAEVELGSVRAEYAGAEKDWDKELAESEQFLNAKAAPLARFVSRSVERRGEAQALVHGEMTFRGVTRPFTFESTYNGAMLDNPMVGKPMIGFSAVGVLKRSDYGLTFMVGPRMPDEVQIVVEAEFVKAD